MKGRSDAPHRYFPPNSFLAKASKLRQESLRHGRTFSMG